MDVLDAQIRQVAFFDTPDLTLNKSGIVVRARRRPGQAGGLDHQAAADRPRRGCREGPQVAELRHRGRCHAGRVRLLRNDEGRARSGEGEGGVRRPAADLQAVHEGAAPVLQRQRTGGDRARRPLRPGADQPLEAQVHARCAQPPTRGRAVALPRRRTHPRALHQVCARRSLRRRRRGAELPHRAGARPRGGAADQDQDGARVLLRPAEGRSTDARASGALGSASTPRR